MPSYLEIDGSIRTETFHRAQLEITVEVFRIQPRQRQPITIARLGRRKIPLYLLTLYEENLLVTSGFPKRGPIMWDFDEHISVKFYLIQIFLWKKSIWKCWRQNFGHFVWALTYLDSIFIFQRVAVVPVLLTRGVEEAAEGEGGLGAVEYM